MTALLVDLGGQWFVTYIIQYLRVPDIHEAQKHSFFYALSDISMKPRCIKNLNDTVEQENFATWNICEFKGQTISVHENFANQGLEELKKSF